ncbi:trehalose synthase [Actinobacteria bacterium OK074]|nr:trehalose synthase [Actinobacteria bacterium OK074]
MADGRVPQPESGDFRHARSLPAQPEWFKKAVFYEVLVRAFYDGNGDGIGDLKGLAEKLDYLEWLGVDCLWLPPFYASPLQDGGYDISDYRKVLEQFGTIEDFVALLDAAHARGLRVIVDLVMNHTSDLHPWFQESRRHPQGPYGDFYVWSDDDLKYRDARVIFVDTETSNWAWDETRGQYYWHRFFSHQPDLNYANPRVQDAMLESLRFWLDLGVDGFRLDAVPYLFAEEGTNCENLPATHEFLRLVRKVVDDEYPGRVLLAEANQWPVDSVAYFGDPLTGGDECHMAFHFPLMPRIFMALRQGNRRSVSGILASTPPIPSGCQWGTFLRNHDELTLEMVTEDERSYLYAQYAREPRMRANIGIRRRLAPLLDGDRRQIELLTALLLALPGSPTLYYGDEIGMGDDIWLPDRDGVRTPMQWSPERNAGFSTADPARLYLPTVSDPGYDPGAVNVRDQADDTSSLLHFNRDLLRIRREHPAFGLGTFDELVACPPAVLGFVRRHTDGEHTDTVLCFHNFARTTQHLTLPGTELSDGPAVHLAGHPATPDAADGHRFALPGHAFVWFTVPTRGRA